MKILLFLLFFAGTLLAIEEPAEDQPTTPKKELTSTNNNLGNNKNENSDNNSKKKYPGGHKDKDSTTILCNDSFWIKYSLPIFLGIIFIFYPFILWICRRPYFLKGQQIPPLKGLALPQGSVRAMLAIAIIGSYLIILYYSALCNEINKEKLNLVLAAFGSLSGAVVGFYFASRGSENSNKPSSENESIDQPSKNETIKNNTSPEGDQ